MKTLNIIANILLVIGGLNWGLVGAFDFNLVTFIFGVGIIWSDIIYILVGIAALYTVFFNYKLFKE
ncbi:MAG: DUF378 domain-containing protein [Candidatus Gracilibacteria bacterium]|nr:DUF378 domain-containing protein [Candidatus Gracilibacteria bacterium]